MTNNKLPKKNAMSKGLSVFLVVLALIYNVSPIDFVLDVTPIIGIADDVILTLAAIVNMYMKWRKK